MKETWVTFTKQVTKIN